VGRAGDAGAGRLHRSDGLAGTLPFQIDHAQIDEWLKTSPTSHERAVRQRRVRRRQRRANFITGLVLMIVMLFFFLKDGPQMWASCCGRSAASPTSGRCGSATRR
jgi:hypothetical protein